jgi:hypothetical protein
VDRKSNTVAIEKCSKARWLVCLSLAYIVILFIGGEDDDILLLWCLKSEHRSDAGAIAAQCVGWSRKVKS